MKTKETTKVWAQQEKYDALLKKMSEAINVAHWNELREEAKEECSMELINKLDSSGYISTVLG